MRILLQHARTGLYLRGLGDWTEDPWSAQDFLHSQAALNFAAQHRLSGVCLAIRFLDADGDETYPLQLAAEMVAGTAAQSAPVSPA